MVIDPLIKLGIFRGEFSVALLRGWAPEIPREYWTNGRNLAQQLRLVVYPVIYGVFIHSRVVVLGFLNHQQCMLKKYRFPGTSGYVTLLKYILRFGNYRHLLVTCKAYHITPHI